MLPILYEIIRRGHDVGFAAFLLNPDDRNAVTRRNVGFPDGFSHPFLQRADFINTVFGQTGIPVI